MKGVGDHGENEMTLNEGAIVLDAASATGYTVPIGCGEASDDC